MMFGVQQLWYLVQCFSGDSDSEFLFSRFRFVSWEKLDHHPVNIYNINIIYIYHISNKKKSPRTRCGGGDGHRLVTTLARLGPRPSSFAAATRSS